MSDNNAIHTSIISYDDMKNRRSYDYDQIIFDIDQQIELLSSQADKLDFLVSIASGMLAAALDILWVGEFSLERGRTFASSEIDRFVTKCANLLGYEKKDLKGAVAFLEKKFPIAADGSTPEFGGGLQHHLRDFAHHPTLVGLLFSLLTQFTYKSYGTDVNGQFIIVNVPETHKVLIGEDVPTKIFCGTVIWFFHLVSDMAGSSSTVGKTGGTGIPGPLLSLAKELSVLPFFKDLTVDDNSLSKFLAKLFNGTLLAQHDENGRIIKDTVLRFDLRGELGLGVELGRQAVPVIANECIVRTFYFIRHFAMELKDKDVHSIADMRQINWDDVKPVNNPTVTRMILIATGVFTTIDIGEAILTEKYLIAVNYVGVGRFVVALGQEMKWALKSRNANMIKQVYADLKRHAFREEDNRIYERMGADMAEMDKFGLTIEQTEILYNIEYLKTVNDIMNTKVPIGGTEIMGLKILWLKEWKSYISTGFPSFIQVDDAVLHWYSSDELYKKIEENNPKNIWFRLVLLESMLFEPYYPLDIEKDKKGNLIPSKKYKILNNGALGYNEKKGDEYLQNALADRFGQYGYIKRLRKCYIKVLRELNEVLKTVITSVAITAVIAFIAVLTAGTFAPQIAVALVGSNFPGLSGAALTNACLAYLGGGAMAAGGFGIAGGHAVVVGGGALLGLGVGAGVGGTVGIAGILGKKNTILQSAKLLVSVREIFLNDEHDLKYSNTVYEQYVNKILDIEKGLVELRMKADSADRKRKKKLQEQIKAAEQSVDSMKVAMKSMKKFISSFETGIKYR